MPTQLGTALDPALYTTPAPMLTPAPVRRLLPDAPTVLLGDDSSGQRQIVHSLLEGMTGRISRFVLDNDPRLVGPLVAHLRDDLLAVGVCDRHAATRIGIALEEALLNAIYHGNLEISSQLKENGDEPFLALARERQTQSPYSARRVHVIARVTPAKATIVIADQGPGFDVAGLPDPTDVENLERPSGRGLLLMRAFMDDVRYNATGNRVTLVKLRSAE